MTSSAFTVASFPPPLVENHCFGRRSAAGAGHSLVAEVAAERSVRSVGPRCHNGTYWPGAAGRAFMNFGSHA